MMQLSAISEVAKGYMCMNDGNGRPCDCGFACLCVCVSFCAGLGLGVLYIFTWKYKSGNQTTNALISLKMQSQGCKKLFGKTVPGTINSLHYIFRCLATVAERSWKQLW